MDLRTLAPGEKITQEGFYAIDIDRHHNQPCDGPSVTSGVLRAMELQTPADVWAFHKLNPNRYQRPDTDALRMGRAMAAFIEFGIAGLERIFLLLPEDRPNRPTLAQRRAYEAGTATPAAIRSVEFWEDVANDPRIVIKPDELDLIAAMADVLGNDPAAVAVMSGVPEITMAVKHERTGLWILSRPDTVSLDGMVSDYKRISPGGKPFSARMVDQNITGYAIDMQMALAADTFAALTGSRPNVVGIVAQSSYPPYSVILREIDAEDLAIASFRNERSITRFSECLASGNWPGPGETVGRYQRPDWQRDMLIEQMQIAGVAP